MSPTLRIRSRDFRQRACICTALAAFVLVAGSQPTVASSSKTGLNGVWVMPEQRGPDADPKLRLPPVPPIPLTPKYRAAYDASEKERRAAEEAGKPLINDRTLCIPDGMPKMMSTTFLVEILSTPSKMVLIAEFDTQVRHIYLDGTPHPPADELEYNFFGHSIGKWEGDTLVVDTVGLRSSTVMFEYVPHTEDLRIIERFLLRGPDLLEVAITMIDPAVLSEPWTVTRLFSREKSAHLREYICAENNRHRGDARGVIETELRGE